MSLPIVLLLVFGVLGISLCYRLEVMCRRRAYTSLNVVLNMITTFISLVKLQHYNNIVVLIVIKNISC